MNAQPTSANGSQSPSLLSAPAQGAAAESTSILASLEGRSAVTASAAPKRGWAWLAVLGVGAAAAAYHYFSPGTAAHSSGQPQAPALVSAPSPTLLAATVAAPEAAVLLSDTSLRAPGQALDQALQADGAQPPAAALSEALKPTEAVRAATAPAARARPKAALKRKAAPAAKARRPASSSRAQKKIVAKTAAGLHDPDVDILQSMMKNVGRGERAKAAGVK